MERGENCLRDILEIGQTIYAIREFACTIVYLQSSVLYIPRLRDCGLVPCVYFMASFYVLLYRCGQSRADFTVLLSETLERLPFK